MNIPEKNYLHNSIYMLRCGVIKSNLLFIPNIPKWVYTSIISPIAELLPLYQITSYTDSAFELQGWFTYSWCKFYIRRPTLQRVLLRLQNLKLVTRLFYSAAALTESKFSKELNIKLNIANINVLSNNEGD